MNDEEFLEERRLALRASVEYFSAKNKTERERWVCIQFLNCLGLAFDEKEVVAPAEDPPDVEFRSARFEIKEILDSERRRHAEYKALLDQALHATAPSELLVEYSISDITPMQVGELILLALERLQNLYAPAVREGLDLLFYVNLLKRSLVDGPMPEVDQFSSFGWRSITALFDESALVLFTSRTSPLFLSDSVGQRKFGIQAPLKK